MTTTTNNDDEQQQQQTMMTTKAMECVEWQRLAAAMKCVK
jgi:hypothetical protein